MKAIHLITLSARIEELTNLVWDEAINYKIFFDETIEYSNLLSIPLQLFQFMPCKNGVPLEKLPQRIYLDNKTQTDKYHEWHEAKKSVIFEGWEVVKIENEGLDILITNSKSPFSFWFYHAPMDKKHWIVTLNQRGKFAYKIKSFADLAEATTSNPLKLK